METAIDQLALWDLVTWRADLTPDAVLAVDESDRQLTFARVPRSVRARRRRLRARRHRLRHAGCVDAADVDRVVGARRRAGASGCRAGAAAPDPARARDRVHPRPERGRPPRGARHVARRRLPRAHGVGDRRSRARRQRDPPDRRRPRPAGGRSLGATAVDDTPPRARVRPDPLGLLHVGHHRAPQGHAAHRPHRRRGRAPAESPLRDDRGRSQRTRVPRHAHRRNQLAHGRPHGRVPPDHGGGVRSRDVVRGAATQRRDDRGIGPRVLDGVRRGATPRSEGQGVPEPARARGWWRGKAADAQRRSARSARGPAGHGVRVVRVPRRRALRRVGHRDDAQERRLPARRLRGADRRPRRRVGALRRDRRDRVHRPDAVQGLSRSGGERRCVHGRRLVPHRRPRHARRAAGCSGSPAG